MPTCADRTHLQRALALALAGGSIGLSDRNPRAGGAAVTQPSAIRQPYVPA